VKRVPGGTTELTTDLLSGGHGLDQKAGPGCLVKSKEGKLRPLSSPPGC
jgi:hypothetical protein